MRRSTFFVSAFGVRPVLAVWMVAASALGAGLA
jgi:hypothetical protein